MSEGDALSPRIAHPSFAIAGTITLEYYGWLRKELRLADNGRPGGGEGSTVITIPLWPEATVRALLETKAVESEAFERLVYDLAGKRVREFVALIVNGRVVELAGGLDRTLEPGDELLLLPGFSGG
ncbi:MAG: MoaD/ThiS family protein [Chloroflexota bacterium]